MILLNLFAVMFAIAGMIVCVKYMFKIDGMVVDLLYMLLFAFNGIGAAVNADIILMNHGIVASKGQ